MGRSVRLPLARPQFPTPVIPAVFPPSASLRHRSAWRRTGPRRATAELHISPIGLPVQAHGLGTISETSPGRSRMVLIWHVASNLPLIGHKVERLFADLIRTSLDADHAFTLNYLEADGPSRRRDLSGFPDALWERKPPRLGRLRNFRSRRLDVCHPVRRRVCGCRP